MTPGATQAVALTAINFDVGTQTRAAIDDATVAEYAAAMAAGAEFPPAALFQDGPIGRYFIGDGWHRLLAAQRNRVETFPAVVGIGGKEAAIDHAIGANITHGLRRSNADKRACIRLALTARPNLSDRAIAQRAGVSPTTVAEVRREVSKLDTSTKRIGGDGKSYPATQPPRPVANVEIIQIAEINFDRSTMTRVKLHVGYLDAYAAEMALGAKFPPVNLFKDGPSGRYFIGDGWHRLIAAQSNGVASFPAVVGIGGRKAALMHALGANASHGMRSTDDDKRWQQSLLIAERDRQRRDANPTSQASAQAHFR